MVELLNYSRELSVAVNNIILGEKMEKDLVLVDSEISMTKKDILLYIEFLEARISEYNGLLATLAETGLRDQLITSRISRVSPKTIRHMKATSEAISQLLIDLTDNVNAIEAADTFEFPHDLMSNISSFFANFL